MTGMVNKKMVELAIAGGAAFWATTFATSLLPVAAEYRAAVSISYLPMVLVESLVGGIIIGFLVSYFLLRFFNKVPTNNPILKSVILSFVVLAVIEAVTILIDLNDPSIYVLVGAVLNVPRFLALGMAIGYLCERIQ